MIRVVLEISGNGDPQGVKEALAMMLERFGDVRVATVEMVGRGQMTMEDMCE